MRYDASRTRSWLAINIMCVLHTQPASNVVLSASDKHTMYTTLTRHQTSVTRYFPDHVQDPNIALKIRDAILLVAKVIAVVDRAARRYRVCHAVVGVRVVGRDFGRARRLNVVTRHAHGRVAVCVGLARSEGVRRLRLARRDRESGHVTGATEEVVVERIAALVCLVRQLHPTILEARKLLFSMYEQPPQYTLGSFRIRPTIFFGQIGDDLLRFDLNLKTFIVLSNMQIFSYVRFSRYDLDKCGGKVVFISDPKF